MYRWELDTAASNFCFNSLLFAFNIEEYIIYNSVILEHSRGRGNLIRCSKKEGVTFLYKLYLFWHKKNIVIEGGN